jgi:site-specific DNA-methyltransferase (adenine-specific)
LSVYPIERAGSAMEKFSRLSDSEVVTPEFLAERIIKDLPVDAINKSTFLLDIASKQGEFVYAAYRRFGKEVAKKFYSIPTSRIAYEFTRKVYKLLEININNIEASYSSYDFIVENKLIEKNTIKINTKKMKFNVIVGNPPYQQSDGGHGRSASPIYHKFVEQCKKLNPILMSIIIPARWFAGGKGLDDFRKEMLSDRNIIKLVDYENANDVFPGVDVAGGICYFLRDKNNPGLCEVTNFLDGQEVKSRRPLNEFSIFIRHSRAIPIIRKILAKNENSSKYLSSVVSSRKPFGLPTNYSPKKSGIPCWFIQKIGLKYASKSDVIDDIKLLDKWKFLVPKAPIAGQTDFSRPVGFYYDGNTIIAKPGECCTESFIVVGAFKTKKEVESFKSYIYTKVVRFLLLQTVISQDVTKQNFQFIPDLGKYEGFYSDEFLCNRWGITKDEWAFIDSRIKAIEI